MPRKVKPIPRRRRPRFATVVCAGLTLAVAVNIALRDRPDYLRATSSPNGETAGDAAAVLDVADPDRDLVVAIQRELEAKGYAPGNEEGRLTLETRAAVLAFEADTGRALTGMPSEAVLKDLLFGGTIVAKGLHRPKVTAEGARLVREIETLLQSAGYDPGAVDGKLDASTAKAIKRFESTNGLKETGRIGGRLAARLADAGS